MPVNEPHYPLFSVFQFYLLGVIALELAVVFVTLKSLVAAALWLDNTMFSLAAVYVMLDEFFFSSRRRHTRFDCDWSSECALPISTKAVKGCIPTRTSFPTAGLVSAAATHGSYCIIYWDTRMSVTTTVHGRNGAI